MKDWNKSRDRGKRWKRSCERLEPPSKKGKEGGVDVAVAKKDTRRKKRAI